MRLTSRIVTIITFVIIVAACVTASAEPPMGPVEIAAANPGDQFEPAVAWDNEHKRWLAVWEQDVSGTRKIVGRLISNTGWPLGGSFFISDATADQTAPDVIYDPGHDRYLVVWVHEFSASDTDIWGRFITWDGLDPVLLPFAIAYANSLQLAPALEYAPFPIDEYFLVWEDVVGFDPAKIRAKRLYPDSGSDVGPSVEVVGDATYDRQEPAVAWNADAGRYLVTYERFEGTAEEDVYAASVSYSGTVFSPDLGIAGYAPEENQIDVAACNGSWMVVWKGDQDPHSKVYARSVAGDLTLGSTTNLSAPFENHRWPAVDCIPNGVGFFVVWEATFTTGLEGVVGAFLAGNGTLGDQFNVLGSSTTETRNFTRPAVSVGDFYNRAYVIWETDRVDLVHHDLAGRWVEMALFADDFETGNTSRWSSTTP